MVYPTGKILVPPIYNLWARKISGLENIPKEGPFIVALNHSSYYDTLLPYTILVPVLNRQMHALVNSRNWDSFFFRQIMRWGKCIPVYVEGDIKSEKKNIESLKKAAGFLREGHIIQIFPEGTRSPDGKLKKAYTGVAKLALKAEVPVLPVGIIGSHRVVPKGKALPRFKRCEVKIGKLMHFTKYYKKQTTKKLLREITTRIMNEIAKLIGQRYNP